ncbi:SusD/RagB family nutrient-binding outer membrane lipoprotein [Halosquirtibacter xylanolyticus]|uniref:SusD/RagB family nutrient-binding outer membrane lipoprotein n=1 Tax=Halosquirtibacter xylanolyticus TaxID=3374599 RepID=UPI003749F7D7|nr:SusD/RagB family nutrient-binding outer membrane lipoprotein [Prolixibacteraceae bacterium]
MKTIKTIYIALLTIVMVSCSNFDEMNVSPNQPGIDTGDPTQLFSKMTKESTLTAYLHQRIHNLGVDAFSQYYSAPNFSTERGTMPDIWAQDYWKAYYGWLNSANTIMRMTKDDPVKVNIYNITRIWKAWMTQRTSDLYGDMPYFQAADGTGVNPKYDTQENIYLDLLKELKEAADGLSPTAISMGRQDFIYGGDVDLWKRFANSLRLRVAIRISNVAPEIAKQNAEEAVAGGVLVLNSEMPKMQNWSAPWGNGYSTKYYVDWGPGNGVAMSTSMYNLLVGLGGQPFPSSDYFGAGITYTDVPATVDPRGPHFFGVSDNNGAFLTDATYAGRWTAINVGLTEDDKSKPENLPENNSRVGKEMQEITRPFIIMPTSEAYFLRAEGALMGWNMGATARDMYVQGVTASMEQWSVDAVTIADYLDSESQNINGTTANYDFNSGANDSFLDKVMTQKYIGGFPDNGWEAWADYRRIQLPVLKAPNVLDEGTGLAPGEFVQRIKYPQLEQNVNKSFYDAAIQNQGADLVSTELWWAK